MKFRKFGQVLLASVVSLGLATGITACGTSNTIDFLYVTASSSNNIAVYTVDSISGALNQIPDSPYPSGGRNPVAEVTSPNGKYLYVVNHDDNTVVEFGIGTDGKLYPQNTYNTPGGSPTAVAISAKGDLLYVVDTFQPHNPAYTDANPGPGALVVYPVTANGSLGSPVANGTLNFWPLLFNPSSVTALANGTAVYVVNKSGSLAGNVQRQHLRLPGRCRWRAHPSRRQPLPCRRDAQLDRQRSGEQVPLRHRWSVESAHQLHRSIHRCHHSAAQRSDQDRRAAGCGYGRSPRLLRVCGQLYRLERERVLHRSGERQSFRNRRRYRNHRHGNGTQPAYWSSRRWDVSSTRRTLPTPR